MDEASNEGAGADDESLVHAVEVGLVLEARSALLEAEEKDGGDGECKGEGVKQSVLIHLKAEAADGATEQVERHELLCLQANTRAFARASQSVEQVRSCDCVRDLGRQVERVPLPGKQPKCSHHKSEHERASAEYLRVLEARGRWLALRHIALYGDQCTTD